MIAGIKEIKIRNERVQLLPEGALYWPKERALVVADFQLGKTETFGMHSFYRRSD